MDYLAFKNGLLTRSGKRKIHWLLFGDGPPSPGDPRKPRPGVRNCPRIASQLGNNSLTHIRGSKEINEDFLKLP